MPFIDSVTSQLISKALDLGLIRHEVIANNVANANTKGYKAFKVDFDHQMKGIMDILQSDTDTEEKISLLKNMELTKEDIMTETDSDVTLDNEMVALNKNVTNYQALLAAKRNYNAILEMAIKGGN